MARKKGSGEATARQHHYAQLIISGLSRPEAYRTAFPDATGPSISQRAYQLERKPNVKKLIDDGRAMIVQTIALTHADLARRWAEDIVTDRNEIAQVRRVPCRYCWGEDHGYQETPAERGARRKAFDQALARLTASTKHGAVVAVPDFDELGGIGYTIKREPHPDCPECFGEGEERVYLADTRKLSKAALGLFEGVEIKSGMVSVKVKDRAGAEDRLARHLGMFVDRKLSLNINADAATEGLPDDPVDASRVYQRIIEGKE
jgi:phage terminase small subunit